MKTVEIYTYCGMSWYDFPNHSLEKIHAPIERKNIKKYLRIDEPISFNINVCFDVFDQTLLHFRDDVEKIENSNIVIHDDYITSHGGEKIQSLESAMETFILPNIKQLTLTYKFILSLRKKNIHEFKLVDLDYKKVLPDYTKLVRHYIDMKNKDFNTCGKYFDIMRNYISIRDGVMHACVDMSIDDSLKLIIDFSELNI